MCSGLHIDKVVSTGLIVCLGRGVVFCSTRQYIYVCISAARYTRLTLVEKAPLTKPVGKKKVCPEYHSAGFELRLSIEMKSLLSLASNPLQLLASLLAAPTACPKGRVAIPPLQGPTSQVEPA